MSNDSPKVSKFALGKRYRKRHQRTFGVPHIGMRIIKTAVAVLLCFVLDNWHGNPPLIGAFAAVICMQGSVEQTWANGRERMWGTVLGGVFGGLVLWVFESVGLAVDSYLFYLVVSLLIVPLIYIMVLLEKRSAVGLGVIVFLVICFNFGENQSPLMLAFNRSASTMLGVVIAGVVNAFLPGQKSSLQVREADADSAAAASDSAAAASASDSAAGATTRPM